MKIKVLLFFISTVILTSCHKKISFPFRIINNSSYSLELFTIRGAVDHVDLYLSPHDTTPVFTLSYERRFRLVPKVLMVRVDQFSDTSNFYTNDEITMIPFAKKDLSGKAVNTILIQDTQSPDTTTNIFAISLQ